MNNEFREQMHNELSLRDTEDLLEIWRTNDHEEWSDMAFEIIKEILAERLGEIPSQEESMEKERGEEEKSLEDDDLEVWEKKLLDDENQPDFYDTLEVLDVRDKINKVAIGVIVGYALLGLLRLQIIFALLQGIHLSLSEILRALPYDLFTIVSTGLQIVIVYFPLKALSHILRILMEMEFRSRKRKVTKPVG